jgi:hypothetical protein
VNETEFAYRIRLALDEGAEHVDYATGMRLEKARAAALARHPAPKPAPSWLAARQLASNRSGPSLETESRLGAWMMRLGLAAPLLALAIGIVGIKQWQNERLISELAETDLAVLLDDTPIDTYAHQGFGVYLRDENNM